MSLLKHSSLGLVWFITMVLAGCTHPTNPLDETNIALEGIQSKVLNSEVYYSEISPTSGSVHVMQVTRQQDGAVSITRGTAPYTSSFQYSSFVVDGASNIQPSSIGQAEVNFDSDAWFVPFDPGVPVQAITSGSSTVFMYCDCYGGGSCSVDQIFVSRTGGIKFSCESLGCSENCIRRVEQSGSLYQGGGLLIKAPSVQLL